MRLQSKVALISGAARGLGAVEARLFAQEGARVAIGDVLEEEGRQVEAEICQKGGQCLFIRMDVTTDADWRQTIEAVLARFGRLDILVNNAGIFPTERVEETSVALWDRVMEVNVKGVFLGAKHAAPQMRQGGGGSIINISSVTGLVGGTIAAAYTASKGAVRLFTKAAAIQYARDGIRVNSIHPSLIETQMTAQLVADEAQRQQRIDRIPLGRLGLPQDVAYGALYLASDESCFVTGSELVIDGGYTAQ